jgi:hypothetical protein
MSLEQFDTLDNKIKDMLLQYRNTYFDTKICDNWLDQIIMLTLTKRTAKLSRIKDYMIQKGMINSHAPGQWTITIK